MATAFTLNGAPVAVEEDGASLLDVLRERLGIRSAKDGCSPQGQCGCCTVLVDGQPRVACVTPARRVAGRAVTTLEGIDADVQRRWAEAFTAAGASQCGFCTPGIVVRLAALDDPTPARVEQALLAHLCRCTGWLTILEAAGRVLLDPLLDPPAGAPDGAPPPPPTVLTPAPARIPDRSGGQNAGDGGSPAVGGGRSRAAAERRAVLEGGVPQRVGPEVALGAGGFAEDTAPPDALVAVPVAGGGWAVAETLSEARRLAGKVQGRRTTAILTHPLAVPEGDWAVRLRTTWVEPGYLEPDASWCRPGGEPASPLANGGAFGGKAASIAPAAARALADQHGRPVRVVLSREDTVRLGPKRPPMAAGVRPDGTGIARVVRTTGIAAAITSMAPGFVVEEVGVPGPPTSAALRAAGWAEAAVLLAAVRGGDATEVVAPNGARAGATVRPDGAIAVQVSCGDPLDVVVLRSYCIGAAHMALGWVRSEGIAVDETGEVHDLTVRSFGILRARDTPEVSVHIVIDEDDDGPPRNGSDAVFAAVAAAVWKAHGLPSDWPIEREKLT